MRFTLHSSLAVLVLSIAALGQSINLDTQVKGSRLPMWGVDSGSANAYAIATIGALGPSLRTGSRFAFIATHANTTASTLVVDGGSTIAIKKNVSAALVSGDIALNQVIEVTYDGTNFQIVGPGALTFSAIGGTLGCSQLPTFTGDVTNSLCAMSVVKVNGGSVPASAGVGGTNSSSQIVAATAHGIAAPLTCADASGSGTAHTCTTSPTFTPAAKDCIWYTPGTTNTGALTLNVNSSSAAPVQKWLGSAVVAGDIPSGRTQSACYDGTNWQVMTIGNAPSGGGGSTQGPWALRCNGDTSGNVFPNVAVLTNVRVPIWEWNKSAGFAGTDVDLHCIGHAPHTIPTGTPKLIFTGFANDSTASHTMTFKECDNHITTTFDIGSPSCSSTANFTTTSTAYAPVVMTFALQTTLSADDDFMIVIHATAQSSLANDVRITNPQLEYQ